MSSLFTNLLYTTCIFLLISSLTFKTKGFSYLYTYTLFWGYCVFNQIKNLYYYIHISAMDHNLVGKVDGCVIIRCIGTKVILQQSKNSFYFFLRIWLSRFLSKNSPTVFLTNSLRQLRFFFNDFLVHSPSMWQHSVPYFFNFATISAFNFHKDSNFFATMENVLSFSLFGLSSSN